MSRKTLSIEYEKLTSLTWMLGKKVLEQVQEGGIHKSNLLEWLRLCHIRVVTEHFRVWFKEYLLQSLEATFVKKKQ